MSMSGIEIRLGFKKRSNSRSYLIGSRSVIRKQYDTALPAAEPRPGPTRMARSRACLTRSQVMRKYDAKPMSLMTLSSYAIRSTADAGQIVAPAIAGTGPGEVLEVLAVRREALRDVEVGQQRLAERDVELGPLGDPQRVVARLRHLAEQVPHLVGGLEVVLLTLDLEALRVRERRPGLHAQQRVVRLVVLAVGVVRVVGGQQRGADAAGDVEQLRVRLALRRQPVILQLDEEVVLAEDLLQPSRLLERTLVVALEQRLQHVSTETSGGGDQTLVVLLEQLPVHPRLVVVALEERQARQLDQVAVAGLVLGQQREVVVELAATFVSPPESSRRPRRVGRSLRWSCAM